MFNCFKKYLLLAIFLGLAPSIYAMENSQKYNWPLSAITGLWSKMPSIPSTLGSWKIRKEAEAEKPKNNEQNNEQVIPNNLEPEPSEIEKGTLPAQKNLNIPIASGGLEEIFKKANAELVSIVETVARRGKFKIDDIENIIILLQNGANPNLKIGHQTLLHIAARYHKELFDYLIKCGADWTAVDGYGHTPFEIEDANKELERALINWKKIPKSFDKIIEYYINNGANPDFKVDKENILHWAIIKDCPRLVSCLLLNGANPNSRGYTENTPLHTLLFYSTPLIIRGKLDKNEMEMLKKLLEYDADPNINFNPPIESSPLEYLIEHGDTQAAKYLIAYNANVNRHKYNHSNILLEKAINKNVAVRELCNAGASIINKKTNETIFHYLALKPTPSKRKIEKILTCARPKIQQKENIKKSIRMVIWALSYDYVHSNFSKLHEDTKRYILQELLKNKDYFDNSNGALHITIYPIDYKERYFLRKTKNRVIWLIEILQKQIINKTASQFLLENPYLCDDCKKEPQLLLDGTQLNNDYNALVENPNLLDSEYLAQNPEIKKEAEKNLAWRIYDNIRTEWSQNSNNPD